MSGSARFARRTFTAAGIYGLIVLLPLYFAAPAIARSGAPLDHPEYYYGFLGAACAMQLFYLAIGRNPVRLRSLMPLCVLAKLSFFVPVAILWGLGRTPGATLAFASVDFLLAIAFGVAWRRTAPHAGAPA